MKSSQNKIQRKKVFSTALLDLLKERTRISEKLDKVNSNLEKKAQEMSAMKVSKYVSQLEHILVSRNKLEKERVKKEPTIKSVYTSYFEQRAFSTGNIKCKEIEKSLIYSYRSPRKANPENSNERKPSSGKSQKPLKSKRAKSKKEESSDPKKNSNQTMEDSLQQLFSKLKRILDSYKQSHEKLSTLNKNLISQLKP